MAAAVPAGSATPGSRKMATCRNGGRAGLGEMEYMKDVGDGVSLGVISTGSPVGTRPKSGWVISSSLACLPLYLPWSCSIYIEGAICDVQL